jgi:starch-binding outer membrane protein, SusD/RagB family
MLLFNNTNKFTDMKNYRFIIKLSLIATLALPSIYSCSDADFLDRKPLGVAAEGDLAAGGFEEKAFGLYGKIRTQEGIADWYRYWFQSIRSDDAAKGSSPTDAATLGNVMDNFNYSANEFAANWDGHYSLIFACNDLVAAVEESGATDQGSIVNAAEAKAIRAFAYFDLRRDYGRVPIILNKIVKPSDGIKPKAESVAEVDAQIISDLEFAAKYLPLSWPAYPGRATKGFANSLLAKLYLYQGDWKKALAKSEEVIKSGQYNLMSSYETLFTKAGNNSSETIFEVQFLIVGTTYYTNNYFESQGVRGSGTWDLGWGFNVPTTNLIGAYETNDPRKAATILYSGQSDGLGNILPAFPPLDQKYWNKKAYTLPEERKNFGVNKNYWENVKIMRYADVLLIAAEAANEDGNSGLAASYLEEVRKRAREANNSILPKRSGGQSAMRDFIKQERRIEFALEGERFYDLVRWGDAASVLGGNGYQAKNQYYPIPQTAIDQSGGILKQNPNY